MSLEGFISNNKEEADVMTPPGVSTATPELAPPPGMMAPPTIPTDTAPVVETETVVEEPAVDAPAEAETVEEAPVAPPTPEKDDEKPAPKRGRKPAPKAETKTDAESKPAKPKAPTKPATAKPKATAKGGVIVAKPMKFGEIATLNLRQVAVEHKVKPLAELAMLSDAEVTKMVYDKYIFVEVDGKIVLIVREG